MDGACGGPLKRDVLSIPGGGFKRKGLMIAVTYAGLRVGRLRPAHPSFLGI